MNVLKGKPRSIYRQDYFFFHAIYFLTLSQKKKSWRKIFIQLHLTCVKQNKCLLEGIYKRLLFCLIKSESI